MPQVKLARRSVAGKYDLFHSEIIAQLKQPPVEGCCHTTLQATSLALALRELLLTPSTLEAVFLALNLSTVPTQIAGLAERSPQVIIDRS